MAMWRLCLVSLATAVLAKIQIILDDMDETLTTTSKSTFEGTFEPCQRDAFGGQFHHDWARNKGEAYFKFTFEVPQDGCYSLEEHHPGADPVCSSYLPSNARLDIDWCKGGKTTMYMDQSTKGGQWNYLGIFPFYVGWEGHLNVSTSADEKCGTGSSYCFMMVDAFRLTRVADSCSPDVDKQLKGGVGVDAFSSSSWQIGSLRLTVEADTADLLGELQAHSSVLEATLETQFGAISVKVEEITSLAAERRRLQSTAAIDVEFKAQLPSSTGLEAPEDLPAALSSALAAAGSELQIQAAELTWGPVKESNANDKDSNSCLSLVIAGIVAASFIGLVATATLARCFYKKFISKPRVADVKDVNKEPDLEKDSKEMEKDAQKDVDDNASTMSPTSVHSTES